MKTIHFARHAQTVFGGEELDDITDRGEEQSKSLNGVYDLVVISEAFATRRTLENSSIKFNKIIVSDLCGEKSINEKENRVLERVEKFKTQLRFYSAIYDRILVISHGVFGWYITKKCLNNCEVIDITSIVEQLYL